ncbi:hypothetical protein FF38_00606 [Lucilia cuprina]|uniref:Uncharacterized protein n=1 Tax=Lucilia cuprina TaxID=7375 RepID=A0A0L0BSP5_LUCCU|nr:hypothetical protein FF38_00606 [Lucilia cuprina]
MQEGSIEAAHRDYYGNEQADELARTDSALDVFNGVPVATSVDEDAFSYGTEHDAVKTIPSGMSLEGPPEPPSNGFGNRPSPEECQTALNSIHQKAVEHSIKPSQSYTPFQLHGKSIQPLEAPRLLCLSATTTTEPSSSKKPTFHDNRESSISFRRSLT